MIDAKDQGTQPLDLGDAPKRRGRPSTGNAMSNADRQRAYRERQKAQRNENPEIGIKNEAGKVLIEVTEHELLNIVYALDDAKKSILKDPKVRKQIDQQADALRKIYQDNFVKNRYGK